MAEEEARTGAIALVETAAGIDAVEAIAATEGLAGLMVGPFDLSVSMGHRGDWRHPQVADAVARAASAARAAGVPVLVPVLAPTPAECRDLMEREQGRGSRRVVLGSDEILIAGAVAGWSGASR